MVCRDGGSDSKRGAMVSVDGCFLAQNFQGVVANCCNNNERRACGDTRYIVVRLASQWLVHAYRLLVRSYEQAVPYSNDTRAVRQNTYSEINTALSSKCGNAVTFRVGVSLPKKWGGKRFQP